jgi:hypothetical protein
LIGHNVVLVFGIERLVLRRDVYFFVWELGSGRASKLFDEVGVVRGVEVEIGGCGVACLGWVLGGSCVQMGGIGTML